MILAPRAGVHYPARLSGLRAWFPDDAACLDYLDWLRWPEGFVCPHCGSVIDWPMRDGRHRCGDCDRRVSVTAGTIFDKTRTPLTVWFEAAWLMTVTKAGVSASTLSNLFDMGSYQTAWTMLHRYRSVMVLPDRDKLSGEVEADESAFGGEDKPGKRGRGAAGKVLVAGAIERNPNGRGFGRARLQIIEDASSPVLEWFLEEHIAPGSTLITDAWSGYPPAVRDKEYEHHPVNIKRSGLQAHESLPGVHRLFSLSKRWIQGTHQGGVQPEHLQSYLDEFVFRFNRRRSRARGLLFFRLLERSVEVGPLTYRDLVRIGGAKDITPTPPGLRGKPGTLAVPVLDRPWRR